jgi:hypothetical protein
MFSCIFDNQSCSETDDQLALLLEVQELRRKLKEHESCMCVNTYLWAGSWWFLIFHCMHDTSPPPLSHYYIHLHASWWSTRFCFIFRLKQVGVHDVCKSGCYQYKVGVASCFVCSFSSCAPDVWHVEKYWSVMFPHTIQQELNVNYVFTASVPLEMAAVSQKSKHTTSQKVIARLYACAHYYSAWMSYTGRMFCLLTVSYKLINKRLLMKKNRSLWRAPL